MKVQKVQKSGRKREEDREERRIKDKEDSGQQDQYEIDRDEEKK